MKNLLFTVIFIFITFSGITQNFIGINENSDNLLSIKLDKSDIKTTTFRVSINGFYLNEVATPSGNAFTVQIDGASPILTLGEPDLPKVSVPLIIPDIDRMEVKVISTSYKDYTMIDIAPSKGNITRDIDPDGIPYNSGPSYMKNQFFPLNNATLEDPYIIRDYRAQTAKIFPFQYNPVTKTLRVHYEMQIEVRSIDQNGVNKYVRNSQFTKVDADFDRIYSRQFINYGNSKYTPLAEQGKMLIICYDNFMQAMQPFVEWKNTIGIPTQMVSKTTAGNTAAAIKTYVANYYNTNGLTFLLLVGDAAQIPTNNLSSGHSDNAYGYITGNDKYQEIFVGRFSAENTDHVNTMVQRTINYEKTPNTTAGIYNNVIGIASNQGPGDDNEYDYQHVRNMQTKLINFTYTDRVELFEGSQGGLDATGNPTAAMLTTELNAGSGCILYTGHGSETTFVTTGFSNTNINNLSNQNKLPFIWSVACVNGDFVSNTCFAEAWLRAGSGTNDPKGAVATLMSTINQSWNPPMAGQDEMVDILTESYPANIKRTFGGLSVNGFFKMNDEYTSQGYEITDTWTIFGDPSLMVRTDNPAVMTVTHAPSVILGASSLQVNCNVDGAFAVLTINNQIIGTAYANSGMANISFPALTTTDSIVIAVTAFNYIPYLGDIGVIPANGPHVSLKSHTISDPSGNNNGKADYGEDIELNVVLENSGSSDALSVDAVLSTTDTNVTITKSTHSWGTIAAGSQLLQNSAYNVSIADNAPDNHSVIFYITMQDNAGGNWTNNFSIIIQAPKLHAGNISVNDAGGNNNGRLDPGENVTISIISMNNGQADALNTTGILSSANPNITITNPIYSFGNLNTGNSVAATFDVTVNASATAGSIADFNYILSSGNYSDIENYNLVIGLVDEDWETGGFNKFNWVQGGNKPWTTTTVLPYEGVYSAKSGSISHLQASSISVTMNISFDDSISFYRKVSSEQNYDFLKFYIDNVEQQSWSGEIAWGRAAFPVAQGNHTFKWTYSKDVYYSSGSDCAWVDYILFPPVFNPSTGICESLSIISSDFNIYPNPATNNLFIDFYVEKEGLVSFKLIDALGRNVINVKDEIRAPGKHSAEINISSLKPGIYFCSVETANNFNNVKKVIIR